MAVAGVVLSKCLSPNSDPEEHKAKGLIFFFFLFLFFLTIKILLSTKLGGQVEEWTALLLPELLKGLHQKRLEEISRLNRP